MTFWVQRTDVPARPLYLKDAVPVREESDRVVLRLRSSLLVGKASQEASSPDVQHLLTEFFGTPVRIECVTLSDGPVLGPSFLAWEEAREQQRREAIAWTARAHPRVKQATGLFIIDARDIRIEIEPLKS